MIYETVLALGETLLDYTNEGTLQQDPSYACITAPLVVRCDVIVDGITVDTVWAGGGGSHSWWTMAGGKLLRHGLNPGQRLQIKTSGPAAFRIDWNDEKL